MTFKRLLQPFFHCNAAAYAAGLAVALIFSGCANFGTGNQKIPLGPGTLVFALSDSISARIPGERTEGEWLLFNGTDTMNLIRPAVDDSCWHVPIFEGPICLGPNASGTWSDVLRTKPYAVPLEWVVSPEPNSETFAHDTLSWHLTYGEKNLSFGDLHIVTSPAGFARGSVATATGDFRFLHGTLTDSGELTLQTFDGAHLFLFTAKQGNTGELLDGHFYSGTHYHAKFTGALSAEPEPTLTAENPAVWTGSDVRYSGIDLSGSPVSWTAENISHPHLISVMGSWCPNCMDEHRLILDMMAQFPTLEVHTLAFERGLDRDGGTELALSRLSRYADQMGLLDFKDRWHITLTGPASKSAARDSLPFLAKVISFPTTIVVSPTQTEPWIHSGFNGPATGQAYDLEKARFVQAINGDSRESR